MKKYIISLIVLSSVFAAVKAEITMPKIFSDNMVLQRNTPVKVWGKSAPNSRIMVDMGHIRRISSASADGSWTVTLPPLLASDKPSTMTIHENGKPALTIVNVLVGEVWISGGQSNMEMRMSESDGLEEAKERAKKNSALRFFEQGRIDFSKTKRWDSDPSSAWHIASESDIGRFSAVSYFFAERILNELKVPVGVVETSLGGTKMCCWIEREDMKGIEPFENLMAAFDNQMEGFDEATGKRKADEYRRKLAAYNELKSKAAKEGKPFKQAAPRRYTEYGNTFTFHSIPEWLYNAKVAPIAGYTARGFIWYQGESDARATADNGFAKMFERVIQSWRKYWGNTDMPFLFVQLTGYETQNSWAEVREQQQMVAEKLDDVYMDVTIDLGAQHNIHPKDKPEVGRRMALIALDEVYDKDVGDISFPVLEEAEYKGNKVEAEFKLDGKLKFAGQPRGFEVLSNGVWADANAKIVDDDTVEISSKDGSEISGIRYLWKNWTKPDASLFGENNLPAVPFRNLKN